MNNPVLYSKHHALQMFNTNIVLENYLSSIKWNCCDAVLDVGSGTGEVTIELLAPSLPRDFKKLVGIDISPEMIELAKSQNQNPKIDFVVCDIMCKDITNYIYEKFDHIFSFYCFQWIQDQRQGIKNMYDLLKSGGDILLTFVASCPIYKIYECMASKAKWSSFMANAEMYISPFQNCTKPETLFKKMMVDEGFTVKECRVIENTGICSDLTDLKNTLLAINPFINKIPENMRNDYINDFEKEMYNFKLIECLNGQELVFKLPHNMFIVLAVKP